MLTPSRRLRGMEGKAGRGAVLRLLLLVTLSPCHLVTLSSAAAGGGPRRFVSPGDGKLVYEADGRGNRVPDFSHCGYRGGGVATPDVPVRLVVPPARGDNGP